MVVSGAESRGDVQDHEEGIGMDGWAGWQEHLTTWLQMSALPGLKELHPLLLGMLDVHLLVQPSLNSGTDPGLRLDCLRNLSPICGDSEREGKGKGKGILAVYVILTLGFLSP